MLNKLQKSALLASAAASSLHTLALEPSDLLLFQKGPAVLKPQFNVTETFNDNITYRKDNQKADLITTFSPGLDLQVGRKDFNFLDLSYFYDRLIYADNTAFDANQHHVTSHLKLQKRRLTLEGNDTIDFLSSPLGGGYSATVIDRGEGISLGGARVDRLDFLDNYRLTWDATERTDLYLQVLHSYVDYQGNLPLYDYRTLIGTLGFEYHPFTKLYFFGETYYGQTENDGNQAGMFPYPGADFVGFFVGARGEFTEHIRGTAKAGFEHRYYSNDSGSLDAPVVEISIEDQLTDKTLISAGYTRRQFESVQFVRSPYTTDSISANWVQQIGADGRLRGIARAGYIVSNFDSTGQVIKDRSDELITGSLTISYDIKLWVRAFGSYSFEHLSSNEPSIVNYNVNRVTLGLQIGY